MTALTRIAAPTVTPLSLDEAKRQLRVTTSDQDALITRYIQAATDFVDGEWGFLGRALVTQTWRLTLDAFPSDGQIKIPLPPLQSVVSVEYDNVGGVAQTVDPLTYFVDTASEPGWIVPAGTGSWPTPLDAINAVRINFIAGYAPVGSPPDLTLNIPSNIIQAMLLMISGWMENREGTVDSRLATLPFGADILLRRHKMQKSLA
jgi:uncharacterized phiE125 gp8 family phage protein